MNSVKTGELQIASRTDTPETLLTSDDSRNTGLRQNFRPIRPFDRCKMLANDWHFASGYRFFFSLFLMREKKLLWNVFPFRI